MSPWASFRVLLSKSPNSVLRYMGIICLVLLCSFLPYATHTCKIEIFCVCVECTWRSQDTISNKFGANFESILWSIRIHWQWAIRRSHRSSSWPPFLPLNSVDYQVLNQTMRTLSISLNLCLCGAHFLIYTHHPTHWFPMKISKWWRFLNLCLISFKSLWWVVW